MSISNKKKVRARKNKKPLGKRLLGIFFFIFGIIFLPIIMIILLIETKTDLKYFKKLDIMIDVYVDFLKGDYKRK
jgi:hypothetical protein